MKNYFLKHLLATLLLLCATAASAYDFEVDGIYYTFLSKEDKTVEVTRPSYSRNEYYGSIVIPESVTFDGVTYSVTSIGNSAFSDCTGLTSIEIPNSITSIGNSAFSGCSGLTSIEIPEGVTTINSNTFFNCTALTSITIPKSVKRMIGAFGNCENITTVNISDLAAYCNIEMLGDNFVGRDFVDMSSYRGSPMFNFISSVYNEIYGGWTHTYSAPKDLMLNGEKIVDLVIPASVEKITGHFLGCSAESISFEERDAENSRLTITSYSFAGMTNLKKVTLPDFDIRLGIATFIGCTSLQEITIGRDYEWAYDNDPYLSYGDLPCEIEIFQGCTHLKKLTAKEGVTRIPDMFGPQFSFVGKRVNSNGIINYATEILHIDTLVIPDLEITTNIKPQTIDFINEAAWYSSPLDQKYDCNVLIAGEPVKEKSGELIIPEGTKGIFAGKISGMNITKIELPNSVTHIYDGAFENCTKLSRINIPDSVTYIGKGAFDNTAIYNNCNEKLLYIDNWLVAYKSDNLGNIKIKEGTKGIADRLFAANTTLTGIELPNSITRINDEAFRGCSGLEKLTTPSSITSIGKEAFYECSGLKEVHINDLAAWCNIDFDYNSIVSNPLVYANNLYLNGELITELAIPDDVTEIKDFAFICCSLTSVAIPSSVTSIGSCAFDGCSGLTSVAIPNSVTSIGYFAFRNCTSLADIKLSSNIKSMSVYAFENTAWYNNCSNGIMYLSNWLMGYKGGQFEQDSLIVKEGTVGIADETRFYGLNHVSLPKSLKHIGENAFSVSNNCTFEVHAATPPTVSRGPIVSRYDKNTLIVPISTGVIEAYRQDYNWQTFSTIIASSRIGDFEYRPASNSLSVGVYGYHGKESCIKIPAIIEFEGETFSVTEISEETFQGNTTVTDIDLPDCVTKIEGRAFQGCSSLVGINIPSSVKRIEEFTFSSCKGIESISIPECVEYIGNNAFNNCTGIKSISIPESVEYIGNNAFYGCSSLTDINIPKSIERIEEYTFAYCTELASIDIPDNITEIMSSAFYCCSSLTSIDIPNSVTTIGSSVFYKCSSLERATIGNGIEEIASSAFRLCNNLKKVELDYAEVGTCFNSLSSIEQIVLGKNVQSISRRAFYNTKNTSLTSVTSLIPAETLFKVEDLVKDYSICTLYVQTGTKEAYAATDGWNNFANIVEMDLTGIDEVNNEEKEEVEIYDLSGRKMNTPSKGIYIINGKKRLIK